MILENPKRYGIKKHTKGTYHRDDCLVLDSNNMILSYAYKASADFKAKMLNDDSLGLYSYYVVRLD